MIDPRSTAFWQAVTKLNLVASKALEGCWDAIPPEKRTLEAADRRLARRAVDAGLLTLWQAQQILAGRQAGLRIDRYLIRELIGIGGMGRVYLAIDTKLRRPVALKILSKERVNSERAIARFRREARVGAQLQHENLIRIYDEGEFQGVRFLVMEYITGQTIAQMIHKQGRLPWALAASLVAQVADGLEHLHVKGLLHRDVNPMNILIDRDGTAKLTDLGLAIDPNDEEGVNVTRDGATVGTFDYISPEQARHSRNVDTRSDIYSLGCTLYHMIAGHVPFPTPSLPEKLLAHQSSYPDPLTTPAPDVPAGLDAIVRRMIAKDPADRFPRPRDVAKALKNYSTPSAAPDRTAQETPTVPLVKSGPGPGLLSTSGSVPPADPTGSDPELRPAAAPAPAIQIDLGSEISLKRAKSSSRSRSGTTEGGRRFPNDGRVAAIAAAILVALALGILTAWLLGRDASGRASGTDASGDEPGSPPSTAPTNAEGQPPPEILVAYDDGELHVPEGLIEAIQFAAGKKAEVVLALTEPLRLEVDRPVSIDLGSLRIRAAASGSAPVELQFRQATPFLRGGPRSRIEISGLTFRIDGAKVAGGPPALIASSGAIRLDHCGFEAISAEGRNVRVLSFEGLGAEVLNCWAAGFINPFGLTLRSSSRFLLENSLIVGPPAAEVGWAFAAGSGLPKGPPPPVVEVERCTFSGAGLIAARGFTADRPLTVTVNRSILDAHALLSRDSGGLEGITYRGERNHYQISGAFIVGTADDPDPAEDSADGLDAWRRRYPEDMDSTAEPLTFRRDPAEIRPSGSGPRPSDYELSSGAVGVGIDPARVGPPSTNL